MTRKRGENGEDKRTFEEWLGDSLREEHGFLLMSIDKIKYQMEQHSIALREGGISAKLRDSMTMGMLEGVFYERHLRAFLLLQEVSRRKKSDS